MNNKILPMSKNEIKRLDFVLGDIRNNYRNLLGSDTIVIASVLNFDNNFIVIEIKYGVQKNMDDDILYNQIKISRKTMQVIEKVGVE